MTNEHAMELLDAARWAAAYIVQASGGLDKAPTELKAAHRRLRNAIQLCEGENAHSAQKETCET